ncbi:aldo/keto reductase [Bryobacterales bacterium F-183]|nr:aldo/keto reductase [Bryobacterales bacterium F-183]
MFTGHATAAGTAAYANRFAAEQARGFFRQAQGLTVSTLGLGSYLGAMTDAANAGYEGAMVAALKGGINFLDTSLNYRDQASERNLGAAIKRAGVAREEYVVCTKAGYLVQGAIPQGVLNHGNVVSNMHSMDPLFLADQLERSRANMGLATVDVFYLHNPETQLGPVGEDEFYTRIRRAFEALEVLAEQGKIQYYGAATWNGFRQMPDGMSLPRMVEIAEEIAGEGHKFRFIQLPFNLAMTEALSRRDEEGLNVLDQARRLGVTVVASASLLQAKLTSGLPPVVVERVTGFATDAQRAIQFTRSTPGISVALTGMGRVPHVEENLGVAQVAPATVEEYFEWFR